MRRLILLLLTILFFISCQKQITIDNPLAKDYENILGTEAIKSGKVTVCHFDAATGTTKTISISENALTAHLRHGDSQGECTQGFIRICDQDWMIKNLDVSNYRNGDPIPQVIDQATWAGLTTGAWCYFENNSANGPIYGKLYNWYAVNDPRGLAPNGWHIPSEAEWNTILNCLGGYELAGGAMKEAGTTHWYSPNTGATNSSGFTGLPGGERAESGTLAFADLGYQANWWSSTENNSLSAVYRNIIYSYAGLGRNIAPKALGISVRCVRD